MLYYFYMMPVKQMNFPAGCRKETCPDAFIF